MIYAVCRSANYFFSFVAASARIRKLIFSPTMHRDVNVRIAFRSHLRCDAPRYPACRLMQFASYYGRASVREIKTAAA